MANRTNVSIDPNKQEVKMLMEALLNEKIFNPKNISTSTDKARCIAELSTEYDQSPRLAFSELRDNLFSPYQRGEHGNMSEKYGRRLCLLLYAINKNHSYGWDTSIIDKFNSIFDNIPESSGNSKEESPFLQSLTNFGALKGLHNTEFLLFEGIGNSSSTKGNRGVTVGKITFKMNNKYMKVETTYVYNEIERKYEGTASLDGKKEYLYIDQIEEVTGRRSNMILRLGEMDIKTQQMMVGHFSYHSITDFHLVSKTVVIQKIKSDSQIKNLDLGPYFFGKESYSRISLEIRQLLFSREKNRMSLPLEVIADIRDLNDFLTEHVESKLNRILRNHIYGEFYVYYKSLSGLLKEGDLIIKYNEESQKVEAKFTHTPDGNKVFNKHWFGKVDYNEVQRVAILSLTNQKFTANKEDEDPVLLNFILPKNTRPFTDCECFPGIISGLEDDSRGPISYSTLVVKKSTKEFSRKEDTRILAFFNRNLNSEISINDPFFILNDCV